MPKALDTFHRAWRIPATAFAFFSFGFGGLLLAIWLGPVLGLVAPRRDRRTAWARATIHHSFRLFIGLLKVLRIVTVKIHGLERLDRRGLLILANHPTLIDVVFLISLVRNADCVVRSGLADNPFTRGPVRGTGYILNAGGASFVDDCRASLEAGGNLLIFPEGTRSRPGQPMQMQRGAAQIAVRAGRDITPVTITCVPLGLNKGRPWWKTLPRPMHFTIQVGEDIAVAPFLERTSGESALAARHLTAYLCDHFSTTVERQKTAGQV